MGLERMRVVCQISLTLYHANSSFSRQHRCVEETFFDANSNTAFTVMCLPDKRVQSTDATNHNLHVLWTDPSVRHISPTINDHKLTNCMQADERLHASAKRKCRRDKPKNTFCSEGGSVLWYCLHDSAESVKRGICEADYQSVSVRMHSSINADFNQAAKSSAMGPHAYHVHVSCQRVRRGIRSCTQNLCFCQVPVRIDTHCQ